MAGKAIYTGVIVSICILCGLYKLFRSAVCVSTIAKSCCWASSRALKRLPVSQPTRPLNLLHSTHASAKRRYIAIASKDSLILSRPS
jgi:hypothetical protein